MMFYFCLNYLHMGKELQFHCQWVCELMSRSVHVEPKVEHEFYCYFVYGVTFVQFFHPY
jgi:hypothetical protein